MDTRPLEDVCALQADIASTDGAPPSLHLDRYRHIVETALEHTVNGVVITDATLPGHPIVHVNRGFTRITGYEAHEVLGRQANFLLGPDTAQTSTQPAACGALPDGPPGSVLVRHVRKDGTLFWNQVETSPVQDPDTGRITHYFALQTDVTLQKQAEEAAMLRSLELERLFNSHPLGMVCLDAHDRIRLLSPAFLKLFAAADTDLQGQTAGHLAEAVAQWTHTNAAGLIWPALGHSSRWSLCGPPARIIEVSRSALDAMSREHLVLFRDVTDEQNQHNSRSEFIAKAAHELRTPMASICGFTELLLMRNHPRDEARPLLETVMSQALRLSALLNDLLDLSQMDALGVQSFAVRPVDLGGVMRRVAQVVVMPGAPRRLQLEFPSEGVRVQSHTGKLEQVLINLLSNALKYSPAGGPVHLKAQASPEPGWWTVSVSDQGLGLSPEHLGKLFTRFFRANPGGSIPGTGLGLVIVKELVDRMGGRIEVRSELGVGTTFTVHLQQADAHAALLPKETP